MSRGVLQISQGELVETTPNQGGDGSQSQAQHGTDPTVSEASQHTVDDPNQPDPSGSQTPAAAGTDTSVPTTTTIPATSQQTAWSPAHNPQQSQSDNEGHGSPGTHEVADDTSTASTHGSRRHDVPTNAGPARVGRGGGSGTRWRREPDQPAAGPGMAELKDIMDVYRRDTREFSLVVEALNKMTNQHAQLHASQERHKGRMEARLDELMTVHREINQSLGLIAVNMQHPPCVTRPETTKQRPITGTGREEEEELSDGESHASSRPAREGPPRKVGHPRSRR
ncbi:uncharacterized protein LOC144791055 [Lissotriton helveticus]